MINLYPCTGVCDQVDHLLASTFDHPLCLLTHPYIAHSMGACSAEREWSLFSVSLSLPLSLSSLFRPSTPRGCCVRMPRHTMEHEAFATPAIGGVRDQICTPQGPKVNSVRQVDCWGDLIDAVFFVRERDGGGEAEARRKEDGLAHRHRLPYKGVTTSLI